MAVPRKLSMTPWGEKKVCVRCQAKNEGGTVLNTKHGTQSQRVFWWSGCGGHPSV